MPPLLADFTHARPCKPFCEKYLTLPAEPITDKVALSVVGFLYFIYSKKADAIKEIHLQ